METHTITDMLGVEIRGLDLREPLDAEIVDQVYQLWLDHGLVLFRDQELDTPAQVRFAQQFGTLVTLNEPGSTGASPTIHYVAKDPVDGQRSIFDERRIDLHHDACYRERPYKATMLYALAAPRAGGETLFANCQQAFEALSKDLKEQILGRDAHNTYWLGAQRRTENDIRPDSLQHTYPAVIRHPETGRPLLYVNRLSTDHIVGMTRDESDRLLAKLFDHIERPEFGYAHAWRAGDIVIWDNLAVVHGRNGFDPGEQRILRRMMLEGVQPEAAA